MGLSQSRGTRVIVRRLRQQTLDTSFRIDLENSPVFHFAVRLALNRATPSV